jgi:hypothetical protein
MTTLEISSLTEQGDRINARRKRAEAKLRLEKEEAEGKKTKKGGGPGRGITRQAAGRNLHCYP